jgi:hypothetical protein
MLSRKVACWLHNVMSLEIFKIIAGQGLPLGLADDFMYAAKMAFVGHGIHAYMKRLGKFDAIIEK